MTHTSKLYQSWLGWVGLGIAYLLIIPPWRLWLGSTMTDALTMSHFKGFDHSYYSLPTYIAELEELCSERKQKGLLCGECRKKYGCSFNSLHKQSYFIVHYIGRRKRRMHVRCLECNMFIYFTTIYQRVPAG